MTIFASTISGTTSNLDTWRKGLFCKHNKRLGLGLGQTMFFTSDEKVPTSENVDCEQSLSFPSVSRVIDERRPNDEQRSREPLEARARRKKGKERDCGGILIFAICRLWHLFDWWFLFACLLLLLDRFSFSEGQHGGFRGLHMKMIVIETAICLNVVCYICILITKLISGLKFCIHRLFA